jgi:plastocyanin
MAAMGVLRPLRPLRRWPVLRLVPVAAVLGSGVLPCHWAAGSAGTAGTVGAHDAHVALAQTAVAQEVRIGLAEWTLTPGRITVPAGRPIRFVVTNSGVLAHALAVEGGGLYAESDAAGSGQTVRLDVTFATPGTYDIYCPINAGEHRALGQEGVLVVAPSTASLILPRTGDASLAEFSADAPADPDPAAADTGAAV